MEKKFTDRDVLIQLEESHDYEYYELGIRPTYVIGYQPTVEQLKDKPKMPLYY